MKREIIKGNYHLKIFERDLKGKTASYYNPKYKVGVLTENGSYEFISSCMTISEGHRIANDYIRQHGREDFIYNSDRFYLIECLGFSQPEIDLIYDICKERDKTVRELLGGFLRDLK